MDWDNYFEYLRTKDNSLEEILSYHVEDGNFDFNSPSKIKAFLDDFLYKYPNVLNQLIEFLEGKIFFYELEIKGNQKEELNLDKNADDASWKSDIISGKTVQLEKQIQFLEKWIDTKQNTPLNHEFTLRFTNNFDSVPKEKVIEHFYINLVKKNLITEDSLILFLENAFDFLELPEEKIKIENRKTKNRIQKLFYHYYKEVAQSPYGKQKLYIKLLTDHFEGFNYNSLLTNFSKS